MAANTGAPDKPFHQDSSAMKWAENPQSPSEIVSARISRSGSADNAVVGATSSHSNEGSPLLASPLIQPAEFDDIDQAHGNTTSLVGSPVDQSGLERSKSTLYLILLTISIGGLQIAWCVELSSITPFLLSLGFQKSLLSLIWIAGPLSGALVQPYVGIRSDNSRLRWGRRRPFMVGGAIATGTSLLALCWTREIIGGILGLFGVPSDSAGVRISSQVWAVLLVYILDFAINVIQAGVRAFIVDCAPTHQQEDANAWASRLTGVGNIIGYFAGNVDLPHHLPWLGHTQFQVFCAIACIAMASTLVVSCLSIGEQDPRLLGESSKHGNGGLVSFFKALFRSVRRLSPQVKRVCQVQLFAWVGWFPFLFYTTTYVGEIYVEPIFRNQPDMTDAEIDAVWEKATRVGNSALLVFALTSFTASMVLPLIISPSFVTDVTTIANTRTELAPKPQSKNASNWRNRLPLFRDLSSHLHIPWLTLRRGWLISHLLFSICMWATFFVHSVAAATVLVGAIGIPWAMTQWAPFALIASEISKREGIRQQQARDPLMPGNGSLAAGEMEELEDGSADQAGVVLGIHNVSIAAPQILATLISSAIFKALQKPRGSTGDDSVAWVFRFAGICGLFASWWCQKVQDRTDR